mmetsp:Transcript_12866/g.15954  ORF Transcript_12866/g.15954 Transcript_12866/m.15954 type:complete len:139 (+) Transcript_12866:14-430(+)
MSDFGKSPSIEIASENKYEFVSFEQFRMHFRLIKLITKHYNIDSTITAKCTVIFEYYGHYLEHLCEQLFTDIKRSEQIMIVSCAVLCNAVKKFSNNDDIISRVKTFININYPSISGNISKIELLLNQKMKKQQTTYYL